MKKPGLKAEIIAPGILLSTHWPHGTLCFSPDGTEVYWSATINYGVYEKVWFMKQENGKWLPPEIAPFSIEYRNNGPFMSHDGKKLFFCSDRPLEKDGKPKDFDIWYVERINNTWSEPKHLGNTVNTKNFEYSVSVSRNGNLYFQSNDENGTDIYCSKLIHGEYTKPEKLPGNVNSEMYDGGPCISPDESYVLFYSGRPGGYGRLYDLYVSFKNEDGNWSKPVNLGKNINCTDYTVYPKITHDGKYFFFIQQKEGIRKFYWVDTNVIKKLKPEN